MLKVLMHGCTGRIGKTICEISENFDCSIVAGVSLEKASSCTLFPTFLNINECNLEADVIIDFSTAMAVESVMKYAVSKNTPVVLCTTGLGEVELNYVYRAAEKIPVLKTSNVSFGINVIQYIIQKVAPILFNAEFDIEIIEKHHNKKIDSPSGTALMLADIINESLDNNLNCLYSRSDVRKKRNKNEIGIHSVRGGTLAGEHSIVFAGEDELVEIKHITYSKKLFAVGAIRAAYFIRNKPKGLYNMNDVIDTLNIK